MSRLVIVRTINPVHALILAERAYRDLPVDEALTSYYRELPRACRFAEWTEIQEISSEDPLAYQQALDYYINTGQMR